MFLPLTTRTFSTASRTTNVGTLIHILLLMNRSLTAGSGSQIASLLEIQKTGAVDGGLVINISPGNSIGGVFIAGAPACSRLLSCLTDRKYPCMVR